MQLVELQRTVEGSADEVAVAAISYDGIDVLSAFAGKHGITYPLLSDEGSPTIERLGLLNTQIAEERAFWGKPVEERHRGLPYPGTFILDEDGAVVEKLFERSHRIRPGGGVLLERLGIQASTATEVATGEGPAVAVAAWVDTPEYFPNQVVRLFVRVAVDPDFHLYVPPNPDGFTDLSVDLGPTEGVFTLEQVPPQGHPFSVSGFDETFTVAEGEIDLIVPFYVLEDSGPVTLPITVSYQACSDTTCLPPDTVTLTVELNEIRA